MGTHAEGAPPPPRRGIPAPGPCPTPTTPCRRRSGSAWPGKAGDRKRVTPTRAARTPTRTPVYRLSGPLRRIFPPSTWGRGKRRAHQAGAASRAVSGGDALPRTLACGGPAPLEGGSSPSSRPYLACSRSCGARGKDVRTCRPFSGAGGGSGWATLGRPPSRGCPSPRGPGVSLPASDSESTSVFHFQSTGNGTASTVYLQPVS